MTTGHHDSFEDAIKPLMKHLKQQWHDRKTDDPDLCSGNYLEEVVDKISSHVWDNWN